MLSGVETTFELSGLILDKSFEKSVDLPHSFWLRGDLNHVGKSLLIIVLGKLDELDRQTAIDATGKEHSNHGWLRP